MRLRVAYRKPTPPRLRRTYPNPLRYRQAPCRKRLRGRTNRRRNPTHCRRRRGKRRATRTTLRMRGSMFRVRMNWLPLCGRIRRTRCTRLQWRGIMRNWIGCTLRMRGGMRRKDRARQRRRSKRRRRRGNVRRKRGKRLRTRTGESRRGPLKRIREPWAGTGERGSRLEHAEGAKRNACPRKGRQIVPDSACFRAPTRPDTHGAAQKVCCAKTPLHRFPHGGKACASGVPGGVCAAFILRRIG